MLIPCSSQQTIDGDRELIFWVLCLVSGVWFCLYQHITTHRQGGFFPSGSQNRGVASVAGFTSFC